MCFGGGSKNSHDEISKNRCFGCEHYDGFDGIMVRCHLGEKVTIDRGCSSFSPDNTAECGDCYYKEGYVGVQHDVMCSMHGQLSTSKKYCSDYARDER